MRIPPLGVGKEKTSKGGEEKYKPQREVKARESSKGGEVSSEPQGRIGKEKYPEWVKKFFDFLGV